MPLAISVIRGDSIEATGNFNVVKLQSLAPTLTVYSSNPRNTAVNIRGLGVPFGLTSDGFEQGVGIYVDDVYNSRVAAATFDFLDVEQVEVLRGPQGSLYGKNTTAGAINITTNQPTFDFEGRAELTVGNFGFVQAKAALSGPLSDKLAVRVQTRRAHPEGSARPTATFPASGCRAFRNGRSPMARSSTHRSPSWARKGRPTPALGGHVEARQDVFDYVEMFYNPVRKQVRNGMLSPVEFERQQNLKAEGV